MWNLHTIFSYCIKQQTYANFVWESWCSKLCVKGTAWHCTLFIKSQQQMPFEVARLHLHRIYRMFAAIHTTVYFNILFHCLLLTCTLSGRIYRRRKKKQSIRMYKQHSLQNLPKFFHILDIFLSSAYKKKLMHSKSKYET